MIILQAMVSHYVLSFFYSPSLLLITSLPTTLPTFFSISDVDDVSEIGEKPAEDTIRKIRDIQVDVDRVVKFQCSWQGWPRESDNWEPINIVMVSVNESETLGELFAFQMVCLHYRTPIIIPFEHHCSSLMQNENSRGSSNSGTKSRRGWFK